VQCGDFTLLAKQYHHRAGYSQEVLGLLCKLHALPPGALKIADIGAGTEKLTEELCALGLSVTAEEPNDAMRSEGMKAIAKLNVTGQKGSGEETSLPSETFDWVLMGFHLKTKWVVYHDLEPTGFGSSTKTEENR